MLDFLFLISAKPVVVTLAIIGAILATFSAAIEKFFTDKNTNRDTGSANRHPVSPLSSDSQNTTNKNEQPRPRASIGSWLNRLGYGIMGISVVLFIIAGFIVDLRG
jgi:hypothetical protein